ncbi:MAG: hypothetical protein QHJ73_06580, partial [Armatimonadota bacterium]|nr:hypothetical protein [Armatimonadota bacterium]
GSKVTHILRIRNTSPQPLTTAPALIVSGGRVLGQGIMTFTSAGGEVDLPITVATDVKVQRSETETRRVPGAVVQEGEAFTRVDLKGTLTLTNYRAEAIEVEVKRYVLGQVDEATHDGKAEMLNVFEGDAEETPLALPYWWRWYSWPSWWGRMNGRGRFTWNVSIPAKQSVRLEYSWHYFWR